MTNDQWENTLSRAGAVLNFGIEKKEQVKSSKTGKFIAAIPFISACNKAVETSFSHFLIYLMSLDESTKDIYFHKKDDDGDIYSRLFPISSFSGGDKKIIQCCMDLLALSMISNYKKDMELDSKIGKYNPISMLQWNYETISSRLIKSIDNTVTPEILNFYTKEDALKGYWS